MNNISDNELIYLINDNNEEAKDYLYEKYSPLIHKEVNKIKNQKSTNMEYNDLLQEAMLAFSEAINNYNEEENVKFITFATLCIKRRLINLIKKSNTEKEKVIQNQIHLDDIIGEKTTIADTIKDEKGKEPLNNLIINESLNEINQIMINKLSDKEKEAFLKYVCGNSVEEIAIQMNLSSKQVYNLIYRARQKIKIN